jgi:hypothetical protein
MRENRLSGSEGGGANPIASPYPYQGTDLLADQNCSFTPS